MTPSTVLAAVALRSATAACPALADKPPVTRTDEQRPVANQLRAYIGLRLNLAAVGR